MKKFKSMILLLILITFTFSTVAEAASGFNSSEDNNTHYVFSKDTEDGTTAMIVIVEGIDHLLALTNKTDSRYPNALYSEHLTLDSNGNLEQEVTDDMLWVVTKDAEGNFIFKNKVNGKYLTASYVDGLNAALGFSANEEAAAHWYLDNIGDKYYLNTDVSYTNLLGKEDVKKFTITRLPLNKTFITLNPLSTDEIGFMVEKTEPPVEETVTISGAKTWEHGDNPVDKQPTSITVYLYADGEEIDSKVVTAEDSWSYSFKNLPKYEGEKEIVYTIGEEEIPDYETKIEDYNITNTYKGEEPIPDPEPDTVEVAGTKSWNHGANPVDKQPTSITVYLYADGEEVDSKVVTVEDGWSYSFKNLPKYEGEKEIVYTIGEKEIADYETIIEDYNITNTYKEEEPIPDPDPETVEVSGTKSWNHGDNPVDKQPTSITVNLYADGNKVDSKVVTAEDSWSYSFKNLPKYEGEKEIVYTIGEEAVENYSALIDKYNITNTYEKKGTGSEVEEKPEITEKPETPDTPEAPKTGDNTKLALFTTLMVASLCGVCLLGFKKKRRA